MEVWKPIIGCEGCYEISDLGNVRSLDRYVSYKTKLGKEAKVFVKGKSIKHTIDKDGYVIIHLSLKGKGYIKLLHRILYQTFVNPDTDGKDIDHIDGNPSNFSLANLRECDRVNNLTYRNVKRNKKAPFVGLKCVFKKKKNEIWYLAQIWCPKTKKNLYLGTHRDPEIAHEQYRQARLKIYGNDIKTQE